MTAFQVDALSRLQYRRSTEAAGRAHGHEGPSTAAGLISVQRQLFGGASENACTGGREGMSQANRTAVHVEARSIDRTERRRASQRSAAVAFVFPRREGA